MEKCRTDEDGEGHVFGSPAGGYMTLICFKNGSLAREKIREHYGIGDWKQFGEMSLTNSGPKQRRWHSSRHGSKAEIVPRVNQPEHSSF